MANEKRFCINCGRGLAGTKMSDRCTHCKRKKQKEMKE